MKVVIFGLGELADLALYYFEKDSPYEVVGFTVDEAHVKEGLFKGLPVVSFGDVTREFPPQTHEIFVAVGYAGLNKVREEKCKVANSKGYRCASYISTYAHISSDEIGSNCFIFESVVLQPFTKIGDGLIAWPGTIISHHSTIADYCYLSPNVTISGSCQIGERVFAGSGAIIRDGVSVASDSILGMGTVVTSDLTQSAIYTGIPAMQVGKVTSNTRI
ncbi:acetyltransferase [Pseudomonadota bacterium]